MIFSRRYLALDLRPSETRAVVLRGNPRRPQMESARLAALPAGLLTPTLRGRNLASPEELATMIRELLDPVAGREERLALVLPESCGRLMSVEIETPFRSRSEGEEILRWQLKGSLPADPAATVLDFQLLERRDNGRQRFLVAAISREVVREYEEAVLLAGYHPVLIGFPALFLHNLYRARCEGSEETLLIAVESGSVTLTGLSRQIALCHRHADGIDSPEDIFRELSRGMTAFAETCPGLRRAEILLQCDLADPEPVLAIVRGLFDREAVLLDPHLDRMAASPTDWPAWRLRGLAAAVGAAEQLMQGGGR